MQTQTISYQEAAAYIMPNDVHKGKSLGWIKENAPDYLRWLAVQMNPRNDEGRKIKAYAQILMNGASQTPTSASAKPKPAPNGNGHKPVQAHTNGNKSAPVKADGNAQKNGEHPRIFSMMTNKAFLHIEDALGIGKIKFFMGAYQKGQGASAKVVHYMDVADARVIAFDLAVRGALSARFTDYKGSPKGLNGKPLSRVLKIEDRGADAKRPIVIQAANGPGELTGAGAIKPAGKPTDEVAIFLTRHEARKLGHAIFGYIRAWEAARMTLTPPETITDG